MCYDDQEEARRRKKEASSKSAALSEQLEKAQQQASAAVRELQAHRDTAADLRHRLEHIQKQYNTLAAEHKALKNAHETAEEAKSRLEQQLQAHRESSAIALTGMEGHLLQLSAIVRSQQEQISGLQATVQLQCRERLLLQETLAVEVQRIAMGQEETHQLCKQCPRAYIDPAMATASVP